MQNMYTLSKIKTDMGVKNLSNQSTYRWGEKQIILYQRA